MRSAYTRPAGSVPICTDMPPILLALAGLLLTTTVYAVLLSTPLGRRWTVAQTWTTVVLGTAIVLAWLAWFDWRAALLALAFFAVGGLPIVIRSLILDFRERESVQRRIRGPL